MVNLLKTQYELVRSSRGEVLNFISSFVPDDLLKPVGMFNNRSIRYFLVHNANVYCQWLGVFAMKREIDYFNEQYFPNLETVVSAFVSADQVVDEFLDQFAGVPCEQVIGTLSGGRRVTVTPLELFTHVTTHEFHHKGQIMTMCRLLGYAPPDTDIIRING